MGREVFNLSPRRQKGSIQGAGLYPQALSIIFFSLVIDRIGYGRTMAFAWIGHIVSPAIITMSWRRATWASMLGYLRLRAGRRRD